jgi:hypothetical protein
LHGVKLPDPSVKADAAPVKSDPPAASATAPAPSDPTPAKPN